MPKMIIYDKKEHVRSNLPFSVENGDQDQYQQDSLLFTASTIVFIGRA